MCVVELAELRDGGRRRLDPGGQRHRDREGQDDGEYGGPAGVGRGGGLPVAWGEAKPRTSTATEMSTNATVMTANSSRPPCPNQVSPATTRSSRSASGIRIGARPGNRAMTALAAAAIEMPMVRTKSTTSAPMGRNVQRAPKARPAAAAAPPPLGKRRTSCQ
ncbi:hypothetical protein GCM10022403_085180 [Streptomyces coacervatus]|uniref:Uncharacterized protein n=1 Tax=Streptomyces coacervatus TaxID=647381 RepID=A0ABP7JBW1_9ACTN